MQKIKLNFVDYPVSDGVCGEFKISSNITGVQGIDIPESFIETHGVALKEYVDANKEIKKAIQNQKKRLRKLKVDFEDEIKITNPEYFL